MNCSLEQYLKRQLPLGFFDNLQLIDITIRGPKAETQRSRPALSSRPGWARLAVAFDLCPSKTGHFRTKNDLAENCIVLNQAFPKSAVNELYGFQLRARFREL
jgi:hypothetical protein